MSATAVKRVVRFGFKSKNQLPLLMVWEEFWSCGRVEHANVLFSTSDWHHALMPYRALKRAVRWKVEVMMLRVVLWALSHPAVRKEIEDIADEQVGQYRIEADDVRGLDRFISDQMSEVDADQIRGLDQAIEQEVGKAVEDALKDLVDDDQIAGAVLDELVKRIQNG